MSSQTSFYYATLHYLRWWLWFDQAELRLVGKAGRLDAASVRRIAVEYSVVRGMGLKSDAKRSAQQKAEDVLRNAGRVASMLNAASRKWAGKTLMERQCICERLADKAKDREYMRGSQVSAITKLMWFLVPQSWTVFDTIVTEGMRRMLESHGKSKRRPNKQTKSNWYYAQLALAGFDAAVRDINSVLVGSILADLPAERIVDSYFLLVGSDDLDTEKERLEAFLRGLPGELGSQVDAIAREIDERVQFPNFPR